MIYLDYAATTPMSPQALKIYEQVASSYFGNANSLHDAGSEAEQLLSASAKGLSSLIGAQPKDMHFTSGATEGNFLGIMALLSSTEGDHIITSRMEHSSVSNVFDHLESKGYRVSRIGVDENGFYDTEELKQEITKDTCLASLQLVNSEIGVIQDLRNISGILKSAGILLHTDAVQAFGRLELKVEELGVDALTISAHKFYGPKGTGALYLDHRIDWQPVMPVSPGRRKLKEGTPDVPAIVAMLTAAKEVYEDREEEQQRLKDFSNGLKKQLHSLPYEVIIEADHDQTVPNIMGIRFPGMEGQFLMLECNQAGMGISTGSACKVGSEEPSIAMKALKRSTQEAQQFVRLSFGRATKKNVIPEIVEKLNVILNRHFEKVKEHH